MASYAERFTRFLRALLPSPLSIALLLTAVTVVMAFFFGSIEEEGATRAIRVLDLWEKGLWNQPLLAFAVQAMLMLALGHMLALSPIVSRLINRLVNRIVGSTAQAVYWVCLCTMFVGWLNWGFGLIFGAVLARKVGEMAYRKGAHINYPLVGAAGYSGMMVWHGGLSGSATIKAAEPGHLKALVVDLGLENIPDQVLPADTVFSAMNMVATGLVFIVIPFFMVWLARRSEAGVYRVDQAFAAHESPIHDVKGAERLDHARWLAYLAGAVFVGMAIYRMVEHPNLLGLGFMNPDWINLLLLGLCFMAHGSIYRFLEAVTEAIGGTAGILMQFPLYFGIMGVISGSGLGSVFSGGLIAYSNAVTYPLITFISSGVLNVFVPSGGGQWAIQGPLIIEASLALQVPLEKAILAMAYGDQLTNMLQPFWALPLLGITGLKARSIAPYTLLMMLVGLLLYGSMLIIF
jgi:short-chain fatty acids transporter